MSASREHWKAMALKNAGDRVRRLKAANAEAAVIRTNQREVMRQAAEFLAELVGRDVIPDFEETNQAATEFISWYLSVLKPLFPGALGQYDFWPTVIDEIARMPFGDEPEIVRPEARSPGQPSKPALLSIRRLRALEWAEYFKANGARPMHFQKAISLSFGTEWDAIRHWHGSIARVIGTESLEDRLYYAAQGYFIQSRRWHQSICDPLWSDGMLYRAAMGIGEMPDHVFNSDWEDLKHILSIHGESAPRYS